MKNRMPSVSLVLILMVVASSAHADIITFEGLGVPEGDPVPTINGVSFSGDIAIQGGASFAFGSAAGNDTGNSTPFDAVGNTFSTNPGGFASADVVKVVEIFFPTSVTDVSFAVADIDSSPNIIAERLIAEAYDSADNLLATLIHTAPTTGNDGDGDVVLVDFGTLSDVRRLHLRNDPVFNPNGRTESGWGIDSLSFTVVPEPNSLALLFATAIISTMPFRRR